MLGLNDKALQVAREAVDTHCSSVPLWGRYLQLIIAVSEPGEWSRTVHFVTNYLRYYLVPAVVVDDIEMFAVDLLGGLKKNIEII